MDDLEVDNDRALHCKEYERCSDDDYVQASGNYNSGKDNDCGEDGLSDVNDAIGNDKDHFDGGYTDSKNKSDSDNGVSNINKE